MSDILDLLYSGDIHPAEDYVPKTREHKKLDKEFADASEMFSEKLDKELAEEYERLIDMYSDLSAIQEQRSYIRGMQLGAKLVYELLMDDEKCV